MPNTQLQKGTVKNIIFNFQQGPSPEYTLNQITFTDNYTALEKNTSKGEQSSFRPGVEFLYEITHPGRTGKPDWIKANRVVSTDLLLEQRDVLIICQNSAKCAVEIVAAQISRTNYAEPSKEEILKTIEQLSMGITIATLENARKIMEVKNYV